MYFSNEVIPATKFSFNSSAAQFAMSLPAVSIPIVGEELSGVSQPPIRSDQGREPLSQQERVAEREALQVWLAKVLKKNAPSISSDFNTGSKVTVLQTEPTIQANRFGDPQADCDLDDLFEGMWIKSNPRNAFNEIFNKMSSDFVAEKIDNVFYSISNNEPVGDNGISVEVERDTACDAIGELESEPKASKRGGLWRKLSDYFTSSRVG